MRTIKALGLATTTALMAMALLGASSASAEFDTALCKVNPAPSLACPEGQLISHVHEATLPGSANRANLLTPLANIRCQVLFLGEVTNSGLAGKPLTVSGTFTYTECNLGCKVEQLNPPAEINVLKTGANTAAITGEGEVLVNCPLIPLHCVYNGVGLEGTALSAEMAAELNGETRIFDRTANPVSGTECPATSKLDLVTTPLEKVYITATDALPPPEHTTALCREDASPCSSGKLISHLHEATLPGDANRARLLTNIATIRCQLLFLGDVKTSGLLAKAPASLVISGEYSYSECNFGCSATQIEGPATILMLRTAGELATVTGEGEVLVNCPALGVHCIYNGKGLEGHGLGPLTASEPNGEMRFEEQAVQQVGGGACPETSKLDLLTTPLEAVYITS